MNRPGSMTPRNHHLNYTKTERKPGRCNSIESSRRSEKFHQRTNSRVFTILTEQPEFICRFFNQSLLEIPIKNDFVSEMESILEQQRFREKLIQKSKEKCKQDLLNAVLTSQKQDPLSGFSTTSSTSDFYNHNTVIQSLVTDIFKPLIHTKYEEVINLLKKVPHSQHICVVLKQLLGKVGIYAVKNGTYYRLTGDDLPYSIQKHMVSGEFSYCLLTKTLKKSCSRMPHLILIN